MRLKQRPEDFLVTETWPQFARQGSHGVYLLWKRKLTTFEAIERLARAFKLDRQAFASAGLKDRQAVSEQVISIAGPPRTFFEQGLLSLKPLGRQDGPITSAVNRANRFTIVVRDLTREDGRRLREHALTVREHGLPNYFDDQRFGCLRYGQGFIARDLVRGRFESALRTLLAEPSANDRKPDADRKRLIAGLWGQWDVLAKKLARQKWGAVCAHLARHPGDFAGAFQHVGLRAKTIHLFAYQSYLWNEAVSTWVRRGLPGDASLALPYAAGRLATYGPLDPERRDWLLGVPSAGIVPACLPLPAHDAVVALPELKEAMREALRREGLTLAKLDIPDAAIFFAPTPRAIALMPQNLSIGRLERDVLNGGRQAVTLQFGLPRGSYATLVVKRLFAGSPDVVGLGPPRPTTTYSPMPLPEHKPESTPRESKQTRPARRPASTPKPEHGPRRPPDRDRERRGDRARPEREHSPRRPPDRDRDRDRDRHEYKRGPGARRPSGTPPRSAATPRRRGPARPVRGQGGGSRKRIELPPPPDPDAPPASPGASASTAPGDAGS